MRAHLWVLRRAALAGVIVASSLASCASPRQPVIVRSYAGPFQPRDAAAFLRTAWGDGAGSSAWIESIDGRAKKDIAEAEGVDLSGKYLIFELSPGQHVVSLGFEIVEDHGPLGKKRFSSKNNMVSFVARRGKTYYPAARLTGKSWDWARGPMGNVNFEVTAQPDGSPLHPAEAAETERYFRAHGL